MILFVLNSILTFGFMIVIAECSHISSIFPEGILTVNATDEIVKYKASKDIVAFGYILKKDKQCMQFEMIKLNSSSNTKNLPGSCVKLVPKRFFIDAKASSMVKFTNIQYGTRYTISLWTLANNSWKFMNDKYHITPSYVSDRVSNLSVVSKYPLYKVMLSWQIPIHPNGQIREYIVKISEHTNCLLYTKITIDKSVILGTNDTYRLPMDNCMESISSNNNSDTHFWSTNNTNISPLVAYTIQIQAVNDWGYGLVEERKQVIWNNEDGIEVSNYEASIKYPEGAVHTSWVMKNGKQRIDFIATYVRCKKTGNYYHLGYISDKEVDENSLTEKFNHTFNFSLKLISNEVGQYEFTFTNYHITDYSDKCTVYMIPKFSNKWGKLTYIDLINKPVTPASSTYRPHVVSSFNSNYQIKIKVSYTKYRLYLKGAREIIRQYTLVIAHSSLVIDTEINSNKQYYYPAYEDCRDKPECTYEILIHPYFNQLKDFDFVIGSNITTCSGLIKYECNGPLTPKTQYKIYLAIYLEGYIHKIPLGVEHTYGYIPGHYWAGIVVGLMLFVAGWIGIMYILVRRKRMYRYFQGNVMVDDNWDLVQNDEVNVSMSSLTINES